MGVPEYYPSGYYSVSMINLIDKAGNGTDVMFSIDTSDVFANKKSKI